MHRGPALFFVQQKDHAGEVGWIDIRPSGGDPAILPQDGRCDADNVFDVLQAAFEYFRRRGAVETGDLGHERSPNGVPRAGEKLADTYTFCASTRVELAQCADVSQVLMMDDTICATAMGLTKMKTILVPTDGSEAADKALDLAFDLARQHDATIKLLHVLLRDKEPEDLLRLPDVDTAGDDVLNDLQRAAASPGKTLSASQLMSSAVTKPTPEACAAAAWRAGADARQKTC